MYETAMSVRLRVICRAAWNRSLKLLAGWWIEPRPLPRAAKHGLELPLLPSPLVRRAGRFFLVAQLLFAIELAWSGHWVTAASVSVVMVGGWWISRGMGSRPGWQLRRLMLAADGRLHGLAANGEVISLNLHASSMSLGRWLLLRVTGKGHSQFLVLGPDNVELPALAELRRRMAFPRPVDFD